MPSLDDWEKSWEEKLNSEKVRGRAEKLASGVAAHSAGQGMPELKVLPVNFRAARVAVAQAQ